MDTKLNVVKNLFPFPQMEELAQHIDSRLPFGSFGASGGYGAIRGRLVKAIRENNQEAAEQNYYDLILDGLEDDVYYVEELVAEGTYRQMPTFAELATIHSMNTDPFGSVKSEVVDLTDIFPHLA